MAKFLQAACRAFFPLSSDFTPKTLIPRLLPSSSSIPAKILPKCLPSPPFFRQQTRNYIAEMRKSAFEGNILRILRTEIQYELEYAPPKQPDAEYNSFTVEDKPGEQWIRLRGKYGEKEQIKVEVTMFDGAIPDTRPGSDSKGEDVRLHISLLVDVSKGENCKALLQFICSAWPDSLEVQRVLMLNPDDMSLKPYIGPDFKDLDDELQDALREFLEERGVNDDLAVFLHEYMVNKDKIELIRWLGNVKCFIEK